MTVPRARSVAETESSETLPSGSRAGVSTALCRAKTPGVGQRARMLAGLGVALHPAAQPGLPGYVALSAARWWASTIAPDRGGDQQRRGRLEGKDIAIEYQRRNALTLPPYSSLSASQSDRWDPRSRYRRRRPGERQSPAQPRMAKRCAAP